ncbi:MAG: DOMON domain-containing protein, partial [Candidatus Bipolaricaulota bacterium]|nr:DOMON domain-containing protein [Candidatus Bipolaricaulota bacterium]
GTVPLWNGFAAPAAANDAAAAGSASGSADVAPLAQLAGATLPTTDGVVYAGEYRNNLYDPQTGMSLFWQNDQTNLYVGLISPGTGWLGVGFSHRTGKPGSNIIIGAVANGTVTIQDTYGVTKELHLPDKTSSRRERRERPDVARVRDPACERRLAGHDACSRGDGAGHPCVPSDVGQLRAGAHALLDDADCARPIDSWRTCRDRGSGGGAPLSIGRVVLLS